MRDGAALWTDDLSDEAKQPEIGVRYGETLAVPVEVENRSGQAQEVRVRLQIDGRRSSQAIKADQNVALRAVRRAQRRSLGRERAGDQWRCGRGSSDRLERSRGHVSGGGHGESRATNLNVPFHPDNRHAIMRRLQRVDWMPHLQALAKAMIAGEKFYLFGEDLNVDPVSKQKIDPFATADPAGFIDRLAKLPEARQRAATAEGMEFKIIELGKGALIVGDASVDRVAYHSSDFIAWHKTLKAALTKNQ